MPTISSQRIRRAIAASDGASTAAERGRILEELIAYLFARCDGVRHFKNNILNEAGSSEIDVCFWNNRHAGSLDFWPQILVVECKNTAERVDSAAIRIFLGKLREMKLDHGVLVAANGITGDELAVTAAHDVIRTAFQNDQLRLVVLTRNEIELLRDSDGLIQLLQDKILSITMRARSF